jgi:hypothetical protein
LVFARSATSKETLFTNTHVLTELIQQFPDSSNNSNYEKKSPYSAPG